MKDFLNWFRVKRGAHEVVGTALFHEREIWWCMLGANVGYEIDGRGETFERPTIIVKKFNLDTCLIVPLTAKLKTGKYYFPVGDASGRESVAVLSQLRLIDRRRLTQKAGTLPKQSFKKLLAALIAVNFTYDNRG